MLTFKRIGLFLLELLIEAVLLGSLMGVLISSRTGLQNGLIGSVLSVPVILALHGYYILRVLIVIARTSFLMWLYPLLASCAFIGDAWFAAWQMNASLSPFARSGKIPFLIGGACIVFICAFIGTSAVRRWAPTSDRFAPAQSYD